MVNINMGCSLPSVITPKLYDSSMPAHQALERGKRLNACCSVHSMGVPHHQHSVGELRT